MRHSLLYLFPNRAQISTIFETRFGFVQFLNLLLDPEFTTMAGRRLRDAIKSFLISSDPKEFGNNMHVVIAGLTNTYSQYIATFEEYEVQRYEVCEKRKTQFQKVTVMPLRINSFLLVCSGSFNVIRTTHTHSLYPRVQETSHSFGQRSNTPTWTPTSRPFRQADQFTISCGRRLYSSRS